MDDRQELELLRRLEAGPSPREELEILRQLEGGREEARPLAAKVGRQVGLTARAGVNALAGIPAMLADAATGLYNAGANAIQGEGKGFRFQQQLPALNQALSNAGLPEPETAQERIVQAGAAGMASPATMGMRTGLAAASGLSSGLAGQAATEAGAPAPVAMGAGLAAGMLPGVVATAAAPIQRVGANLLAPLSQAGRDQVKGRILSDMAGDKRQAVVDALNADQKFVRGTQNTAATAAAPAGSTEFAGLEKVLEKKFEPTAFRQIAADNEAARLRAIQTVGKTPADLQTAIAARSGQGTADYGKAFAQQVKPDVELAKIVSNPYIADVIPDAIKLAKAKGVTPDTDLASFLHLVKLAIDDKIASAPVTGGLGPTVKRATVEAQQGLVNWLKTRVPEYDVARQNFADASKPINRMQVGQALEAKLTAPLDASERPGVFAQALRDAPGTIKRATGSPRFDSLDQVLPRAQQMIVEGVGRDLSRQQDVRKQASIGQGAAQRKLGIALEPVEPPGMLNRTVMLARAALERLQTGTSRKTLAELAVDMQDPAKAAKLMQGLSPQEQISLITLLRQSSGGAAAALPQIQEQQ